jgi:YVTN family beta-propeller protein
MSNKDKCRMTTKRWMLLAGLTGLVMVLLAAALPAIPAQAQGLFTPTPRPLYALPDPNAVRVSRSNVIALAGNQRYAVTANTFSGTASIVDIAGKVIVAELPVGDDPRALVVAPDQAWMAVTSRGEGTVSLIDLTTFEVVDSMWLGVWPWGVATNGTSLFVALQGEDAIVELDVETWRRVRTIAVPDNPTGLALWGEFLYVAHFESGAVSMIYLPTQEVVNTVPGTPDSRLSQTLLLNTYDGELYMPATRAFADNPALTYDTTAFPVVNVFDLANLSVTRQSRLTLAVSDRPVNLPFDLFFDRARRWLWVVNAGSNDVSVVDTTTGFAVANIKVGDNPRGITAYADGRFAFVYNALDGTISVVESAFMEEVDKLPATELELPIELLIGAQAFYGSADERLAEDRWLSCATCHFDGADDGQTWVGFPGGSLNTPLLYGVHDTLPWGWRGDYDELADFDLFYRIVQHGDGLQEGVLHPPLGEANGGRSPDLDALVAYLNTFEGPGRNALRIPPEDILAGEAVWTAQGCAECHTPPLYMDSSLHDLGDGPINTPSLRWLWDSAPYYHDGRAETLFDVFRVDEGPHALVGQIPLGEIDALIMYLNSLPLEE